ncbi:MAG TPA: ABC transporter substrate-binding protein [Dehalococcoidia bacterium]|nr:ABC transporter substrate-binding protein [Dehalococcoidia bacterium]
MNCGHSTARSVFFFLACSALVLGLAACGGGGDDGDQPTPSAATGTATSATSGEPVEITMWHTEVAANLDAMQALTRRYNDSQNEVRVKLAFQGEVNEEMTKLVASLGSGQLPHLVYINEGHSQRLIDTGAIAPVQEFIDRDKYDLSDLDKRAVKYYTAEGKLWAMPFAMIIPMLFYNKVTFRDVGLDPEKPPTDLEEMRQFSEKMLERDAHGNLTRSGVAIDINDWHLNLMLQEHGDLFANNDNGRAGRATEVLFNGPTGQAFFQWWHDMVDEGLALNVGRNPTYADAVLAVATGRAGMTFASSAHLRSVVDLLELGLEGGEWDLGVANEPGVPGGTRLPGIYGRALWILKSNPQEEQEAAWKFIQWLMEPEQQAEWYAGSGYLPVSISAYELPAAKEIEAKYPQFKIAADLYLASSTTSAPLGPLLGPHLEVAEIIVRAGEEMLVGDKDPIDALDDAAEEANGVLEDYNRRVE